MKKASLKINNKTFASILLCSLLGACVSPPPQMQDKSYEYFAGMLILTYKCFEDGYINPKFYTESKQSTYYIMSTWSYNPSKFNKILEEGYKISASTINTNDQGCRNVVAENYQLINNANQHSYNVQAQKIANQKAINSMNKSLDNLNKTLKGGTNQNMQNAREIERMRIEQFGY